VPGEAEIPGEVEAPGEAPARELTGRAPVAGEVPVFCKAWIVAGAVLAGAALGSTCTPIGSK